AADAGPAVEDFAEMVAPGDRLHLRAGVGDGDEMRARLVGTDRRFGALEEILLQNVGFERGAGCARDDEERARRIDPPLEAANLRRVGRIEDQQFRAAASTAEGL